MKDVKVYRKWSCAGGVQRSGTSTPFTRRPYRQVRGFLAAAARAVLGAVLLLAVLVAALWPAYGPQGPWTVAWLVAEFAAVTGAVLGWHALMPKEEAGDG